MTFFEKKKFGKKFFLEKIWKKKLFWRGGKGSFFLKSAYTLAEVKLAPMQWAQPQ
jgi:hypothetical protein